MLDRQKHDFHIKNLLRRIANNYELNNSLIFKGGTCLYLFYNLPRFSVDLDFNLKANTTFNSSLMTSVIAEKLNIIDSFEKQFTWFWLCSYEKGLQKIKVEISKRNFPDKLEVKSFYGLSINTLSKESLFAHKLCAITDRSKLQNRDLFDANFMFEENFPIDEEIIILRTGKSLKDYLVYLAEFIKNNSKSSNILDGLGELLEEKQKIFIKNNLINELLFQINLKVEQLG